MSLNEPPKKFHFANALSGSARSPLSAATIYFSTDQNAELNFSFKKISTLACQLEKEDSAENQMSFNEL